MKRFFFKAVGALAFSALGASAPVCAQRSLEPLTNTSVIKLVRAGFKEKTVIAIIHSRPSRFDLTADGLIELKRSGVTENTILAMLAQDGAELSTGDEWSDDAFFKRSERSAPGNDDKER